MMVGLAVFAVALVAARRDEIGDALLFTARDRLRAQGDTRIIMATAAGDQAKSRVLDRAQLSLTSAWWTSDT